MPLNEIEVAVVKTVVHQFLSEKKPSARKPLLLQAGSRDVLDKLARWSILKTSDHQSYFPTALSFHYCGDADALRLARESIQILAGVLKSTFELEVDDRQFSPEEIETLARMKYKDDPSRIVDLEKIKLGLYLANEFNLISRSSLNSAQTEIALIGISDYVVEIKDPETHWDEHIKRQIEWVEGQAGGVQNISTNQSGFDSYVTLPIDSAPDHESEEPSATETIATDAPGSGEGASGPATKTHWVPKGWRIVDSLPEGGQGWTYLARRSAGPEIGRAS